MAASGVLGFITIIKALLRQDFRTIDQRISLRGKQGNILAEGGDDKVKMIVAETERLILRHFHIVDAPALERIFCDPEVMRYSSGVKTPQWVRKWLHGCLEDYFQKWGFGLWAVVEKRSHNVIGYCGLSRFEDVGGQPETEIGYRLARDYWGHGFATEAACAVRDYGMGILGFTRLISIIDANNVASIRVAEKVGMRYEKDVLFQGFVDRIYAIGGPVIQ